MLPNQLPYLTILLFLLPTCDTVQHNDNSEEESKWDDPWQWEDPFEFNEYGSGFPPEGKESLFNIGQSNDGSQYYIVRERPAGEPFEPLRQLWVVDKNGENPRYLTSNIFNADWSMDDERLAVALSLGISAYIFTLNLKEHTARQWTGWEDHPFFDSASEITPTWAYDDEKLFFTVRTESYGQTYAGGAYFLELQSGEVEGPVTDWWSANRLGNHEQYIWSTHSNLDEEIGRNLVRLDRHTGDWDWLTMYQKDAGETHSIIRTFSPDPRSERIAVNKKWQHSMQLFLYDRHGEPEQITTGGSGAVSWNHDSSALIFLRDIRGRNETQFVPFRHDLETGETEPLWPDLPDYLPEFPDRSAQEPIPIELRR